MDPRFFSQPLAGFESHRCFFCGGVWHPATGFEYTDTALACGRCYREFSRWKRHWTARPGKKGQPSFYEAAAKFKAER